MDDCMKHYTYVHCTPDGDVFYVGKGTGNRVYSMSDRSIKWREVVAKHDGILMKIVQRFGSEQDAFDHERKLIDAFKKAGADLVNATSGGKGVKDFCQSEESRIKKSLLLRGYIHNTVVCPHCGESGGETAMKRWHFENCTGKHPKYKARVTINGVRMYLGKFNTKKEADAAMLAEYAKHNAPVPKEFYRSGTGRTKEIESCQA